MRRFLYGFLFSFIVIWTYIGLTLLLTPNDNLFTRHYFKLNPQPDPIVLYDTIYTKEAVDVDALIKALAWVESRWDDKAESNKNARGYLQITPILVEEVNRLGGNYTHEDAWDREKSIEMFHIIMRHYNPTYDIHLCAKLWNPLSKLSYHTAIETKYKELCKTN